MKHALIAALAASCAISSTASAKDFVVEMRNSGTDGMMVFQPALTSVGVGDRVIFKATNPSHDAASIPTMMPAGAKPFTGKISQDGTVTFTVPGFYGIKCTPHFGMGMVALIKVGKPTNGEQVAQAATKLPPMARKRLLAAFAKAK